jgi:thiamine-monophosphate kinase
MDEKGRIAMVARLLASDLAAAAAPVEAGIEVGIGDDGAVLATSHAARHIVFTIDEQVEGTHFRRDLLSFRDIGWRSFMAAASDLAAMGAIPWCALSALVLPDDVDDAALEGIVVGQRDAASALRAPIVGGNMARGPRGHGLSIATTLLGTCEFAVARRGARAGHGLWLAGTVGLAAAGLKVLERGIADEGPFSTAVAAWRTPRALVVQGRLMAAVAHAAIDVSDGLARDAGHLAESSGVCVVLDEPALVADAALVGVAAALDESPLDLALYGGEDYALAVASRVPIPGFRCIGEIREGDGLVLRGATGERPIEARGYDHFAVRNPR